MIRSTRKTFTMQVLVMLPLFRWLQKRSCSPEYPVNCAATVVLPCPGGPSKIEIPKPLLLSMSPHVVISDVRARHGF
ncbi:hypothetical protein F5Y10DRAFT_249320 [Nemania abortiva]|nr:hypothetical protein F5Y10DRAFT_249320 [Nemania abortiva]